MAGEQHRIVGDLGQLLGEALVQENRIAAGEVGSTAALEEQGIAGDQAIVDQETLRPRCVSRSVDQLDGDLAHHHHISTHVLDEVACGGLGDAGNPGGLIGLDVDGNGSQLEQLAYPLHVVAHHVSADMVGVIVGGKCPGEDHAVGRHHLEQTGDVIGGVDDYGFTRLSVADQIDEVHHLAGDRIMGSEVTSCKQLAEVEALGHLVIVETVGRGRRATSEGRHADTVNTVQTFTVIGVGAIGGYYGARLHQAGFPVRFLARSDADHVRRHGLRIDSPEGDAVLDVDIYDDPLKVPTSDTVIVATKTTGNAGVLAMMPGLAVEGSRVLVMQNGLGVERPFHRTVPGATVLGAMCFMCCHKVGPGHIVHVDAGAITIGEYREDGRPAGINAPLQDTVDAFRTAHVTATPTVDLEVGRWQKLVWNVAFNGLSVVLDTNTAGIVNDPSNRRMAELIMHEVVNAAQACGHGFDESFIGQMLATTEQMVAYLPSMKEDYDAGRPLELDAIYAAPVAAANAAGAPMPRTEVLLSELRRLDDANRAAEAT